jgi:hypothetical protein
VNEVEPRRIKKLVRRPHTEPAETAVTDVRAAIRNGTIRANKSVNSPQTQKVKEYIQHSAAVNAREFEGYVTLTQLAIERGIQPQLARIWVNKAEVPKPKEGWRWKVASRDLTRIRKLLGLPK